MTIPKALRDKLGIRPKTVLDFRKEDGKLVEVKQVARDPVGRVTGCLELDASTDVWLEHRRDHRR